MPSLTLYRQQRRDGAIRTGIDVDGNVVVSSLDPEMPPGEGDSALDWYVDVSLDIATAPDTPIAAVQALKSHAQIISRTLQEMSVDLSAGVDAEGWPVRRVFNDSNVSGTISASAVRRVAAHDLGRVFDDLATRWRDYVEALSTLSGVRN